MVDKLFLLRALIDHSKYVGKQLWLTFYDNKKGFDSMVRRLNKFSMSRMRPFL